jgi:hypothetical protein
MAKVSIGLRGWRFEEEAVFDGDDLRPIDEMPDDERERLLRLTALVGEPCDLCWLEHGDENIEQCNAAAIVYGEPMAEVLLCDAHEAAFLYWYREDGGSEFAGTEAFQDRFHEWYATGNRAPEDYGGLDHVDEAPDRLPEATDDGGIEEVEDEVAEMDPEEIDALDVDLDDLDV